MQDQRDRSLKVLAAAQAIVSGLIAIVIFARMGLDLPAASSGAAFAAAILGALGLVYFATLHQILRRSRLALSTLVLTAITAINVILVIVSTGGLDSPYYSFWLLVIVVAGIFGRRETIIIFSTTLIYYAYAFVASGLAGPYLRDHVVQLVITVIAALLSEWVHSRNRTASATGAKLETISSQLSTEQLKAEAIMSSIGEGVMVVDTARRIQLFNKAAQELSGWDESSAQNIDLSLVLQLKTAEDQPPANGTDPFASAWKSGKTVVQDNLFMTTRAGRKIQVNISVSPIFDTNHQPNGAIALFRDISKEKEVERQKEEFVSTASHEMRTPVAAIEGYLSLAMNPNVATIDERAKKYLDKAHDAIGHLGDLFKDLLSATKLEEGKMETRAEPVNLAKLLQDISNDMQQLARGKGLTLVFQVGNQGGKAIAPLYYVAANPERLREVVMNLIDNGIKFTSQGGLRIWLEGNDKEVTVSVQDTGVGIAQEDIPHLFQKFYRVDSTATRTIGGTGLGLYICRHIIELFNGRIWIESKVGEGSTFKFALPRLTQDEVARMQAAATQAASGAVVTGAGAVVQPAPASPPASAPGSTPAPPVPVPPPPPPPKATPAPVTATPVPGQDDGTAAPAAGAPSETPAAQPVPISVRRRVQ